LSLMIQPLTAEHFKHYGKIIEYPRKETRGTTRNLWRIVHTASQRKGWRVAYLVLRDKTIGRMECHPDSDETFEPVQGRALFFVAREKDVNSIECFHLDRPVVLYRGIWHGLIAVTPETEIKIIENSTVICRYWPFGFRIRGPEDLCRRKDTCRQQLLRD